MSIVALLLALAGPALAFDARVLESVVSVLPKWPGHGGVGLPPGPARDEPEATAVAIAPGGYLVTALHVIGQAESVMVRLGDGRRLPAEEIGRDRATDLAVLRIERDLPVLPLGPEPALGAPVCAVGNQFGLDLSVTCGVVSAVRRSGVGFNSIEDFIQTDAVVNPGASGGALVDAEGRLVGILSAIFTKQSDADIGVNFAVSTALTLRVVGDLIDRGRVAWPAPGYALIDLRPRDRLELSGARVLEVMPEGPAARAGLRQGDVITAMAGRRVRKVEDAQAAWFLHRPGQSFQVSLIRDGAPLALTLTLPE